MRGSQSDAKEGLLQMSAASRAKTVFAGCGGKPLCAPGPADVTLHGAEVDLKVRVVMAAEEGRVARQHLEEHASFPLQRTGASAA